MAQGGLMMIAIIAIGPPPLLRPVCHHHHCHHHRHHHLNVRKVPFWQGHQGSPLQQDDLLRENRFLWKVLPGPNEGWQQSTKDSNTTFSAVLYRDYTIAQLKVNKVSNVGIHRTRTADFTWIIKNLQKTDWPFSSTLKTDKQESEKMSRPIKS